MHCVKCKKRLRSFTEEDYYCGECDDVFCKECFYKYCKPLQEETESDSEENDYFCKKCRKVLKDYK